MTAKMVSMTLVLWIVGFILGNGYGIYGQNYVALLLGNEMAAVFHYRNLMVVCATQDLPVGLCSLVCVESLWMIKVMVAGFFHWV